MIYINDLSISNDKTKLNVNVETNFGANIVSAVLWNHNTFKDYSKAIDISFKLEQINNREVFILTNEDININEFDGIYFIEFTSNYNDEEGCSNCQNTVIGIAANLNNFKKYLLNEVLNLEICDNCPQNNDLDNVINIHLILKTISLSLSIGYYDEAIFLYNKLKKLIGPKVDCRSCNNLRTPEYINGLNFVTFNNSLILT